MELQKAPLRAAAAILADKGAPPAVSAPDGALYSGRDIPRAVGGLATGAGAIRGGQLRPGKVLEQRAQGSINDLTDIAVGNLMAQEGLRAAQLRVGLGAGRELNPIAFGGQRHDDRGPRGR